jgi:hypothetical protein
MQIARMAGIGEEEGQDQHFYDSVVELCAEAISNWSIVPSEPGKPDDWTSLKQKFIDGSWKKSIKHFHLK